eukprot:10414118-Ditylum_brightwellii.AAC.1
MNHDVQEHHKMHCPYLIQHPDLYYGQGWEKFAPKYDLTDKVTPLDILQSCLDCCPPSNNVTLASAGHTALSVKQTLN